MAGDEARTDTWPKETEARDYLKKHKVLELFDNLTSQLIYSRPDDPKEFLVETLAKLQQAKSAKLDFPCLFDESNITSVFGMMDPTNKGFITLEQYKQALWTLGVTGYDDAPSGSDIDRIAQETFAREAKMGLERMSATFEAKK